VVGSKKDSELDEGVFVRIDVLEPGYAIIYFHNGYGIEIPVPDFFSLRDTTTDADICDFVDNVGRHRDSRQ